MATPLPVSSTAPRRNAPARTEWAGLVLVGVALTVMAIVSSTMILGRIHGEEFSPDNFTRRTFSYFEVPLIGVQVSPISRTDRTNALESYLTSAKLVDEIKTTDDRRRWDLVVASRGNPQDQEIRAQGEARILCTYLDAEGPAKNSIWLDWTKQHPEMAKILWRAVAKVARQELYPFVPELLDTALRALDTADLQKRVDELLARQYCEFATTQQQLTHHEAAVELFTEALTHAPRTAKAFAGRAASLTALGQSERAAADLRQAQ